MKNQIYTMLTMNRFCRAPSAEAARRIFSRSLNADKPEGSRPIAVSLAHVRAIHALPHNVGILAYDEEVKRMPQRYRDEEAAQSYNTGLSARYAKRDKGIENAENVVSSLFDGL
jgi:hypothetical protein